MAKAKAKRVPLGKPLPKIKDSYEETAPSEVEVEALVSLWDRFAPAEYRGLMNSQTKSFLEATKQKASSRFVWDDQKKHYIRVATGAVLTRAELHQALSSFVKAYSGRR